MTCKCGRRFRLTQPNQTQCSNCGGRLRFFIAPDETVAYKWNGPAKRIKRFMESKCLESVNALDVDSLWAVVAAAKAAPYPEGDDLEPYYLKMRAEFRPDPKQREVSLGELRKYVLQRAGNGLACPVGRYLRCAYDMQTMAASLDLGGPDYGIS